MGEIITSKQTGQNQFRMLVRQDVGSIYKELASGAQGGGMFAGRSRAGLFDTINTSYLGNNSLQSNGLFQVPVPSRGADPFTEWQSRCEFAMNLYLWDPVVGTAIETLCDLTAAGARVVTSAEEATTKSRVKNQKISQFYEWLSTIDLNGLIRWSVRDYTLFGRASVIRLGDIEGRNRLYTLHNPSHIAVLGAINMRFDEGLDGLPNSGNTIKVGVPADYMEPSNMSYMGMQNDTEFQIPSYMKPTNLGSKEYYVYDPRVISFIDRRKPPYSRYPTTPLLRAAFSYRLKRLMSFMDEATAEDMVNCIVLVTVGNDKYPATKKQMAEIQRAFETDKRSFTVYWNHTLNVQMLRPPAGEILGRAKYEAVNAELYAGIGVPMFLIDASSGNSSGYSNQWVQVEILLRRLDAARQEVKNFWERELNDVAQKFGVKERISVVFDKVDLRPQDRFKSVVLGLRQLGLISGQTAQEEAGFDPRTEIARLEEELALQKQGLFVSQQQMTKMQPEPGRPESGPGQPYDPNREPSGEEPSPTV